MNFHIIKVRKPGENNSQIRRKSPQKNCPSTNFMRLSADTDILKR